MSNFLFKEEKKISNQFKNKGFVIKKIDDFKSLLKIKKIFVNSIKKILNLIIHSKKIVIYLIIFTKKLR